MVHYSSENGDDENQRILLYDIIARKFATINDVINITTLPSNSYPSYNSTYINIALIYKRNLKYVMIYRSHIEVHKCPAIIKNFHFIYQI